MTGVCSSADQTHPATAFVLLAALAIQLTVGTLGEQDMYPKFSPEGFAIIYRDKQVAVLKVR